MRSSSIAAMLFARRAIPMVLVSLGLFSCFGTNTPPSTPTRNPLDDAPPAAPVSALPSSPQEVETKKNKFDDEQAKIVLTRAAAAAHTCVDVVSQDQPHGDGTVVVTFSGTGKSTKAVINSPFDGTPIGQCVTRAFVNIVVSPFEGPDVDMNFAVNLKPDEKTAKKDGRKSGDAPKKK